MRKPTYQYFSLEEYQQRLDALRQRMERKGADAILVTTPENLYYLTGYQTVGYYWYQTLIVPMDREPVFVTRLNEESNIGPLSWVEDSRPYQDHEDWVAHTREVLVDLGLGDKRIGLQYDSFFMTVRDEKRLTAMLPSATFMDCSGLVEEGRVIKSPQEIDYIRQAARTVERGIRAGVSACQVGVTENDVAAEIHYAQIKAGSEYTGLPIFVRTGERDSMTHATWYRNKLEPGDSVTIEMPGCINRYHAAVYRQIYLGDPPPLLLRGMEVGKEVLQKAKDAIKPGVPAGEIHNLVQSSLTEIMGPASRRNSRTAYSIGIAFAPDWGEGQILSMTEGEQRPLRAGMTFHLLAGAVPLQGLGKVKRAICSDTVLVTDQGCETLTEDIERKLFVK
jgi:Xaa-Pro dipeptidase